MALGSMAVAVKHVGSTSVPGLSAKPILDIAVAVPPGVSSGNMGDSVRRTVLQDEQRPSLIALVATEDVTPRQQCGDDVQHDDAQWERWLAFRNLLRNDSRARAGYNRLKRELAARCPDDRQAYASAKTSFITALRPPSNRPHP